MIDYAYIITKLFRYVHKFFKNFYSIISGSSGSLLSEIRFKKKIVSLFVIRSSEQRMAIVKYNGPQISVNITII